MWTLGLRQKISNTLFSAPYTTEDKPPSSDSEFWGSLEEFEVQLMLQQLISTSLDYHKSLEILLMLRDKLTESSTGWIDRFVTSQGTLVLHKLLEDTVTSEAEVTESQSSRELALVECFKLLYTRSPAAQQLFTEDPNQQIQKTLLKCLISPNERIRRLVSETILAMKQAPGNPFKVLHTLTLSRH